jgi:Flp pilus assembly protein TadB
MEFLIALVVLILVVWLTKSLLLALIYIAAACLVLYLYRRATRNR